LSDLKRNDKLKLEITLQITLINLMMMLISSLNHYKEFIAKNIFANLH